MLNQILFQDQLDKIIVVLLGNKLVRLIRTLRATGRSKVAWVYYAHHSGRRATFLSRKDLVIAFSRWLSQIDVLKQSFSNRIAIGKAMYLLLHVSDAVFHVRRNELGVVVEKRLDPGKIPTIFVDWGKGAMPEQPYLLEVF